MAVKDSGEIATNSNYTLGDYSFRIERTSVPGSTNDKIEAICTDKDGKNARKSIQVPSSTQLDGWYVEANETEATVYVTVKELKSDTKYSSDLDTGDYTQPVQAVDVISRAEITSVSGAKAIYADSGVYGTAYKRTDGNGYTSFIFASSFSGKHHYIEYHSWTFAGDISTPFTCNGKTVYWSTSAMDIRSGFTAPYSGAGSPSGSPDNVAWTLVYGTPVDPEYETKTVLIARFAIEIEDAGGVGPGSDWTDPGDYDPDWEEGDPTHTLYVTVTGALSGRHNDPIEDPSYSYIPADKDTVKDYGCGGDGGHGGGGGAGASTVVVYKFATNQANSKEVTAIARRHGYGSGGGKGGKGGDGCILVYY